MMPNSALRDTANSQAYQTRLVNEEVATNFKTLLPPVLRSLFSPTTALTELIPLLMRIISPPLKPVCRCGEE